MIQENTLTPVGKLFKPHSFKGMLKADIPFPSTLFNNSKIPFFIKIDNIFVPFFVESVDGQRESVSFIKFKDIDSDGDAEILARKTLYATKSYLSDFLGIPEEELGIEADEMTGFEVIDFVNKEKIGIVERILEGKEYDYLEVLLDSTDQLIQIPFVDEMVQKIIEPKNNEKGKIYVDLPEGLLEI